MMLHFTLTPNTFIYYIEKFLLILYIFSRHIIC